MLGSCVLLTTLFFSPAVAQTVTTTSNASQLANALVGPGVTVSGATLTCPSGAAGTFTSGTSPLGINKGILLTSGVASAASATSCTFASNGSGAPGDADLTTLAGYPTNNACVLEFNFVPKGDTVVFRYQFASEEYPDYTCSPFNDVFGFLISGPGYAGKKNIAIVPGTNVPVSINTVNSGTASPPYPQSGCPTSYPAYFINHPCSDGSGPVYDGLTKVLVAKAAVTPCSTYHFKLGIADGTDGILDSGVFLEEGSLTILKPVIANCPNDMNVNTGPNATLCGANVTWTEPTVAGNCVNVTSTQTHHPGDFFNVGTTTVTYTFTNAGGTSTCSFKVTVKDNTPPVITCPGNATVSCEDNTSATAAGTGVATATDNCGTPTVSHSDVSTQDANPASPAHYNYTITRTWTATYGSFSSSCTQVITVQDVTAPSAQCQNVSVTLMNGAATVTAAQVDHGSSDNCGPVTLSLSKTNFSCADIGGNTVTLTVKDVTGNTSTCTATVTVIGVVPTCHITANQANNTCTGGIPTNIYLGYGPQSVTLDPNASGGAPFTYVWTGPAGLDNYGVANPVFTASTPGNFTYNVTVTNSYGCTTSCSVTICVKDVRVPGTDGKKIYVCHLPTGNPANANTLSVSVNAVPAHVCLHGGDRLGTCEELPCTSGAMPKGIAGSNGIRNEMAIYPNPNNGTFTVEVPYMDEQGVQILVTDMQGKVIARKLAGVDEGNKIQVDLGRVAAGLYLVEVVNGENRLRTKVNVK